MFVKTIIIKNKIKKRTNKSGEKYTCLLTEFNLHNKGVQKLTTNYFF